MIFIFPMVALGDFYNLDPASIVVGTRDKRKFYVDVRCRPLVTAKTSRTDRFEMYIYPPLEHNARKDNGKRCACDNRSPPRSLLRVERRSGGMVYGMSGCSISVRTTSASYAKRPGKGEDRSNEGTNAGSP